MGERKVLNKYYPPDFDPAKIPRRKQPKNQQIKVRMMLPMSIRCNTCGNYIYKGTKFNSRKEDVEGETYLGIQIFRFYFKCSKCSAELTMKTDPQNSDYIMETGASRNYEPWRATDEATDEAVKKREAEELGDAMKALENRTLDSKQEMDIMAALDEMKSMRSRHATVAVEDMMAALRRTAAEKDKELEEQDEAVIKSVIFQNSSKFVRRIDDDDLEDDGDEHYDEESSLNHAKSMNGEGFVKRRKVLDPQVKTGPALASEILAIPVLEAEGSIGTAKAPSFAVSLKPVAFNIKPKAGTVSISTKEQSAKGQIGEQAAGLPEVTVEKDDQQPSGAFNSLGLAYGSSEDDSE
ncbi:uncharacterized protein [Physcomitrium patens]|uniref:Splicing factor YJU2 n=1 Tax=Physcomitrium patens TaxID=3218 RepID=A0A7I4CPE9_PHYPA|nr:coiled-coil domain-containing protein 94-like isoform X2 [Physcomitrium patens]|eukprot:XP_024363144.1 coiled-coil domain-containing protein 94-like isoform X2 [Physcomitrella patens]